MPMPEIMIDPERYPHFPLSPCPLCGGKPIRHTKHGIPGHEIHCTVCETKTRTFENWNELVRFWNTRIVCPKLDLDNLGE